MINITLQKTNDRAIRTSLNNEGIRMCSGRENTNNLIYKTRILIKQIGVSRISYTFETRNRRGHHISSAPEL
jgi:hypothetical protein